jgi:hypothetical protein
MKTLVIRHKTLVAITLALGLGMLTAASAFASNDGKEVSALIKCHEGKFDAMNAVSQLTAEIGTGPAVYGWSGIGAYPDGHMDGEMVYVRAPFTVSAPTFTLVGDTTWACVTVQKR